MPIYSYECCGQKWEEMHPVNNRNEEICDICGKNAKLVLSVPSKPIILEYYSENLNARITGPKQKAAIMKERNVSEAR